MVEEGVECWTIVESERKLAEIRDIYYKIIFFQFQDDSVLH